MAEAIYAASLPLVGLSGDGSFIGTGVALGVFPVHHDLVALGTTLELEGQVRVF